MLSMEHPPPQHCPCKGITNAHAPQPPCSHQDTRLRSAIRPDFAIGIPHGSAVLTAFAFVIPQTLWKWLSDGLHCLGIFTLSTINKNCWSPAGHQKSPHNPHSRTSAQHVQRAGVSASAHKANKLLINFQRGNRAGSHYKKINATPKIALDHDDTYTVCKKNKQ